MSAFQCFSTMCSTRQLPLPLYLICAAVFLFACNERHPLSDAPTGPSSAALSRTQAGSTKTVFNLAALVNLPASKVRARLGKPISDQQESINEEMRSMLYRRKGYELSIDYELQSQRLVQIYFTTSGKP